MELTEIAAERCVMHARRISERAAEQRWTWIVPLGQHTVPYRISPFGTGDLRVDRGTRAIKD